VKEKPHITREGGLFGSDTTALVECPNTPRIMHIVQVGPDRRMTCPDCGGTLESSLKQ